MNIPKQYGQSKVENCPFCGKRGIIKNGQGVPVCQTHKNSEILDLKCVCGEYLDLKQGKYGPYFSCMNCGNINFNKGLAMNPPIKANDSYKEENEEKSTPKEITVRSDQIDALYG